MRTNGEFTCFYTLLGMNDDCVAFCHKWNICIVFSEIIQLAYYYILDDQNLGFIYSFFLVIAFVLLYVQSQLEFTGPEPAYSDEQLEA